MKKLLAGSAAVVVAIPVALVFYVAAIDNQNCAAPIAINASAATKVVSEYTELQLANAISTINAGYTEGAPPKAQTIALMVALADDALAGPLADAAAFYQVLLAIDGWEALTPSVAANAVRPGDDPYRFDAYYQYADTILTALADGVNVCTPPNGGAVNSYGWTRPVEATQITGDFGPRTPICTPAGCSQGFHNAVDMPMAAGSPIYAASGGTVIHAGPNGASGNTISIDHGNNIITSYSHMYASGLLVKVGQTVQAGQVIGAVGCAGVCTAAHLHFQVRSGGFYVNPQIFMRTVGVEIV